MAPKRSLGLLLTVLIVTPAVAQTPTRTPVVQERFGVYGTPDLGRQSWKRKTGAEVTIQERVRSLRVPGRVWPLKDSLGQPMGGVRQRANGRGMDLIGSDGTVYGVSVLNIRGRGCAVDQHQSRTTTLAQVIAGKAPAGGVQGFLELSAFDTKTEDGAIAVSAHKSQKGTGCGPSGPDRGRVRKLVDPDVDPYAHAKLSNGVINDVKEYDAKAAFGNVVYFMSNTTAVKVGGVARGMIRVGTPVATVDRFRGCDPTSDGTLTWRYVSIRTGNAQRPKVFGWIPARCRG